MLTIKHLSITIKLFSNIYLTYMLTRVSNFKTYDGTTINNEARKEF